MLRPLLRRALPVLLLPLACGAAAAAKPSPHADAIDYAKPGTLVAIAPERHLNLRCIGHGAPTLLLESGNNADSMTWQALQPMLAQKTRVCAYDRAGIGFSDGGPLPRNVDTNADDIAALIASAHLATPLVLIGHSYGTDVVRRFADKHADQVSALILLDPPAHAVGEFAPEFEKMEAEQNQAMLAAVARCAKGAAAGQLDDPPPELKACLRPPNPAYSDALNRAIRANKLKASFWQAITAIAETNVALYAQPIAPGENHGAMPLLVLQPDAPFADEPEEFRAALEKARQKTQRAIAATSSQGKIVPVAHSSHDVQVDRPDAVVEAVDEVLQSLRHGRTTATASPAPRSR